MHPSFDKVIRLKDGGWDAHGVHLKLVQAMLEDNVFFDALPYHYVTPVEISVLKHEWLHAHGNGIGNLFKDTQTLGCIVLKILASIAELEF
jgi:hypothetical protein